MGKSVNIHEIDFSNVSASLLMMSIGKRKTDKICFFFRLMKKLNPLNRLYSISLLIDKKQLFTIDRIPIADRDERRENTFVSIWDIDSF